MKYYIVEMPDSVVIENGAVSMAGCAGQSLAAALINAKEAVMFNPVVDTPCMVVDTWTEKPDKTKPISEIVIKGQVKISDKPVSLWVVQGGKD